MEINNIALIDRVNIELGGGLNILTGETGAGKSIIIDSINAIMGERVTKDLIRSGKEKASVQAVFSVDYREIALLCEKAGIEPEEDGTLIVSREFSVEGKSSCRVNGRLVTVSFLKELGELLIDMHGQHDNQSLLRVDSHRALLDSFIGADIEDTLREYGAALSKYKEIKSKIKSLSGNRNERERKIDLLKYQMDEIKGAKLKKGEEESLTRDRAILAGSEKIFASMSAAYDLLFSDVRGSNSIIDGINGAISQISSILKIDDEFADLVRRLEEHLYGLQDVAEDIRNRRDGVEFNPGRLEEIEERLDIIFRLKKKYGSTIEEILQYQASISQEFTQLTQSDELVQELTKELDGVQETLFVLAGDLHEKRRNAAIVLEDSIGKELDDLEMKRAKFKVEIMIDGEQDAHGDRRYTQYGLDKVEFMISPNAGEPLKPLSKIASGGEMSRIMLAIKNILADVDRIPTLVFDEIDTGISGRAAQKVGEKLSDISQKHQVLCVTHLPQIAAMAEEHFGIEKVMDADSTRTFVTSLKGEAAVEELARMLGGASISGISLDHAREMLRHGRERRKKSLS